LNRKGFIDFDLAFLLIKIAALASLVIVGLFVFKSYRENRLSEEARKSIIELAEFYKNEFPQFYSEIDKVENHLLNAIDKTKDKESLIQCLLFNQDSLIKQISCLGEKDRKKIKKELVLAFFTNYLKTKKKKLC